MERFNRDEPSACPQCGNRAQFKYCANRAGYPPQCVQLAGTEEGIPHMHRTCTRCGYEWAEEPTA